MIPVIVLGCVGLVVLGAIAVTGLLFPNGLRGQDVPKPQEVKKTRPRCPFGCGAAMHSYVCEAMKPAESRNPTPKICAVPGCQIRVTHSHTEALLRRIKEK